MRCKDEGKPLVCLQGEVRTPPFSSAARIESGLLMRRLQRGDTLELPHSRPMPRIGNRCHELRVNDADANWRVVYRVDRDAVVIADVFRKTTRITPTSVIQNCIRRLGAYNRLQQRGK